MSLVARLDSLEKAVTEYADKEKGRIEKEVKILKAIKEGRGAAGVKTSSVEYVAAVADNDLRSFLEG